MGNIIIEIAVGVYKIGLKDVGSFIVSHWEWVFTTAIYPAYLGIKKAINLFKRMNKLEAMLPQMSQKLDMIVAEFTPTGNGGIKDQITRIERRSALTQQLAWNSREDSPNGEFTTDENGSWTRANKTFLKIIDAQDFQVIGNGWLGYVREEEDIRERYDSAIQEKRGVSFVCHLRRSDDSEWAVTVTIEPLRADGKILGYVGKVVKRN